MSAAPKRKRRQSGQQALRQAVRKAPRKAPTIPNMRALSALIPQRRRFVLAYCGLGDGDLSTWWQGAPAARAAGYSETSARYTAAELLSEPTVRAAIDEVKAWLDKQNDDQRRRMLDGINAIAFDPTVRPSTRLRAMELYLRAIGHLQEPGAAVQVNVHGDGKPREGATIEQLSRVRQVMGLPAIDATASEGPKWQNREDNQRRSEPQAIAASPQDPSSEPADATSAIDADAIDRLRRAATGSNGHTSHAPIDTADDDEAE